MNSIFIQQHAHSEVQKPTNGGEVCLLRYRQSSLCTSQETSLLQRCDFWLVDFKSVLLVSVFQGSLLNFRVRLLLINAGTYFQLQYAVFSKQFLNPSSPAIFFSSKRFATFCKECMKSIWCVVSQRGARVGGWRFYLGQLFSSYKRGRSMILNWNLQRGEGRFKPSGSQVFKRGIRFNYLHIVNRVSVFFFF